MKYKIKYLAGGAAAQPETGNRPEIIFTNETLRDAVNLWCSNDTGRREATNRYGHISTWNVSRVTSMSHLFRDKETFNDDISSIRINQGYRVIVYEHDSYKGKRVILNESQSELKKFKMNDEISSLVVERLSSN